MKIEIKKREAEFMPFEINLSHSIIIDTEEKFHLLKTIAANDGSCRQVRGSTSECRAKCPFYTFESGYGVSCTPDLRKEILEKINLNTLEVIK